MEKLYHGKTIEEAVENACNELGLSREEISSEVVEMGSKGFLGIGAKDCVVKVTYTPDFCAAAREYLEGLFEKLGIEDAAMDITCEKDTVNIQVTGEDANVLLKNHGESVDALQLLISLLVNREGEDYLKVSFNVNDYKEKTKTRLEALALKTAGQVVRNRRKVTLPPMTSFQRRIIHSKLQDYKDVTTYSVGEDPSRRVVVSYCGADGPAPRKDGNRSPRRDGGNRGPRRDGNRGPRRDGGRRFNDRGNRGPRREYVPEGEVYTGAITHLPGEKLSGANSRNGGETATPITGGTPFTMDKE